jgi:predicted deacylase
MKSGRRDFLRFAGIAGMGLTGSGIFPSFLSGRNEPERAEGRVTIGRANATLEDGSKSATPYWRVDSGREGPSLLLLAAQHGNEIQGAEVARRFKEVCARLLVAGSVWLLPMANLLAVRSRRHSFDLGPEQNNRLSEGRNNMQRTWPGDPQGNNTERLAYALDQAVLRHCSHVVDMHCWEHFFAAETLAVRDHEASRPLGDVTTTRFVRWSDARPPQGERMMVAQLFRHRGFGALVMELSGQFQMRERQVRIGLSSMVNIAKLLGMIEGEPELIEGPRAQLGPDTRHDVVAPCVGIFMPAPTRDGSGTLAPEEYVEEGQSLGHIIRENDLATVSITAPVSGYLWQYGLCHWSLCDASLPAQHPYADEGDRVAVVVTV